MLGDHQSSWIKLPQAHLKRLKRWQKAGCNPRRSVRQHKKCLVGKKPIPGSLHQALAPVFDFGLNRRQIQVLQGKGREIFRIVGRLPRHENQIGTTKAIQGKLTARGVLLLRGAAPDGLLQIDTLEFGEKIDLSPLRRRHGRQIPAGVMAAEVDSARQTMGRACGHLERMILIGTGDESTALPTPTR